MKILKTLYSVDTLRLFQAFSQVDPSIRCFQSRGELGRNISNEEARDFQIIMMIRAKINDLAL